MKTGRRAWKCELSTIDSAFLFAGMLTAATISTAIRRPRLRSATGRCAVPPGRLGLGAQRRGDVSHGWTPETGFSRTRWTGYDEALLLYILGLGSPTLPAAAGELRRLLLDLLLGDDLRPRNALLSGRCSSTNSRTCGSTFAAFATRSCASSAATTSRTVAARRSCTGNTRSETRCIRGLWRTLLGVDGERWPRLGQRMVNGIEREFFDYLARGAPSDRTTAPSPRGPWSPPCRSPPRL